MKSKKEAFAEVMQSFSYRYDLRTVFDDFLTISICALSQNLATGMSHDEDLYMATIAKYTQDEVRVIFPKLFALLVLEMESRIEGDTGNDVLGEFYEVHLYRKGTAQYFTPWPICQFMAQCLAGDRENDEPKHVLDPCCGSGRTLLASAKSFGRKHRYYGIDIDHTCVKMAAINLFLNGIFHSEVMWGDALSPNDFRMSYVISFLPLGIFRVNDKENSRLWHLHLNSFEKKPDVAVLDLSRLSKDEAPVGNGTQLDLF